MTDAENAWKYVASQWRHNALLFMALYSSSAPYTVFQDYRYSKVMRRRQLAVSGRARAVVLFDQVLNNEQRGMSRVKV
ncbi:hypothetical protein [Comamonas koreensis]|uniref:Uncharacterized protein n=1 Tax=Comamonas koreensis TaxID=160825 RepID=A0AAW4XTJ5_9BURK|nr:hypothetical protein [Comamonas koreensis]MCD2164299.1 hypothetical protein [Comamonas koreensis]